MTIIQKLKYDKKDVEVYNFDNKDVYAKGTPFETSVYKTNLEFIKGAFPKEKRPSLPPEQKKIHVFFGVFLCFMFVILLSNSLISKKYNQPKRNYVINITAKIEEFKGTTVKTWNLTW